MARSQADEAAPEVSFVVIAYNEEARLGATLASIAAQDGLGRFEIVVVDDASIDGTGRVVASLAGEIPGLRLVRHDRNRGRGAARASGVEAARGSVIVMADGDIVFPPHWWATCRRHLETYDGVGGTAVPDGDVAYVHQRCGLVPRVRRAATVVSGSNGAFRAEAIRAVGFDRGLTEGEDVAANHALERAGYRLFSIPGLTVEHREDKDLRQAIGWLFTSGKGATRQLWRYRRLRTPDLVLGGFLASLLAGWRLRRRPGRAVALVAAYPLVAAGAHLAQRFELDPRRPCQLAGAIALDAVLLVAYFLGRIWGTGGARAVARTEP